MAGLQQWIALLLSAAPGLGFLTPVAHMPRAMSRLSTSLHSIMCMGTTEWPKLPLEDDAVALLEENQGDATKARMSYIALTMAYIKDEQPDVYEALIKEPTRPDIHEALVEITWDSIATFLPVTPNPTPGAERRLAAIANAARDGDTTSLLEVGCGHGLLIPFLTGSNVLREVVEVEVKRDMSTGTLGIDMDADNVVTALNGIAATQGQLQIADRVLKINDIPLNDIQAVQVLPPGEPSYRFTVARRAPEDQQAPFSYRGIDLSSRMINTATTAYGQLDGIEFEATSFQKAAEEGQVYDTIIFNGSLQFFGDIAATLAQAATLLSASPCARIVISHIAGAEYVRKEKADNPATVLSAMPTLGELQAITATLGLELAPWDGIAWDTLDEEGATQVLDDFYLTVLRRPAAL